jgi:hypothetical protein
VWSDGGKFRVHSIDRELFEAETIYRSDDRDSQRRKINIKTAITEICLPIEEIIFHDR